MKIGTCDGLALPMWSVFPAVELPPALAVALADPVKVALFDTANGLDPEELGFDVGLAVIDEGLLPSTDCVRVAEADAIPSSD